MDGFGISIEGLGRAEDNASGSLGTVWALEPEAPTDTDPDSTGGDYVWTWGLSGFVTPSGQSVVPETGEVTVGAFSAEMHADEDQVTKVILARQNEPTHALQATTDIGDTTITLTGAGLYSAGDVIFVGAETMRVSSDDGGGTYTVERGYWSSREGRHLEGAGVYDRPPFYKNRAVTLWTHDGTDMTRRSRAFLQGSPLQTATRVSLQVEEALGKLKDVRRMRAMPDLREQGTVRVQGDDQFVRVVSDLSDFESRVAKGLDASGNDQSTWYYGTDTSVPSELMYAQIGGATLPVAGSGTVAFKNESNARSGYSANETIFGDKWDKNKVDIDFDDDTGLSDEPVYELAVWNRGLGKAPYPLADLQGVVANEWHPVIIAGLLMCSTDSNKIDADELDFVNGDLGLGVPWLFGDEGIQAFIDVANEDEEIEIDQLVLGWDGEPVDVLSVAIRLMLSAGYYLGPDTRGYLIPKRFRPLDVSTFDTATGNRIRVRWPREGEPVWEWDPGYSAAIQEKTGVIGKTPMYDGYSLTSLGIGASARIDTMMDPAEVDYDFQFFRNTSEGRGYVQVFLERQAALLRGAQPRVKFQAHDYVTEGTDYDIGTFAVLDIDDDADPIILNKDGTFRTLDDLDTKDLAVLITDREPAEDFNGYTLTGRATNFGRAIGRFRAPSAEVSSWDGGTDTITVSASSQFGADQSDENGFTVGQQVQIYDSSGALRTTTTQTIQDVSTPQEIELDGDFGLTPAVGDILELATYDNYTFQDFGTLRGYCYLAGSSDTLGSGNDDADEWQ
jgi:hypothetical protein